MAARIGIGRASRWQLGAALVTGGLAALLALALPAAHLGYDATYALVIGNDLLHGQADSASVIGTPTHHPLTLALGAIASAFGTGSAPGLLLAVVFVAFGAVVWGTFDIGRRLFGAPAGVVAALAVATSASFLLRAAEGYQDLIAVALVVLSAVVALRAPHRPLVVLGVVTMAGLVRPEAWLFAGAYLVWAARGRPWSWRLRAATIVACGPLAWAVMDQILLDDPFAAFTGTRRAAIDIGRRSGLGVLPDATLDGFVDILGAMGVLAACAGLMLGLWRTPRRMGPVAIAGALGLMAFAATAVSRLPLHDRYLYFAAVPAALCAGHAVTGWSALDPSRARRGWVALAAVLAALLIATAPARLDELSAKYDRLQEREHVVADLDRVLETVSPAALARCGPIVVDQGWMIPRVAQRLDLSTSVLVDGLFAAQAGARPNLVIQQQPGTRVRTDIAAREQTLGTAISPPLRLTTDPGLRVVERTSSWTLSRGAC